MSEFFFPEVMLLKSDTIADSGTLPLNKNLANHSERPNHL